LKKKFRKPIRLTLSLAYMKGEREIKEKELNNYES